MKESKRERKCKRERQRGRKRKREKVCKREKKRKIEKKNRNTEFLAKRETKKSLKTHIRLNVKQHLCRGGGDGFPTPGPYRVNV